MMLQLPSVGLGQDPSSLATVNTAPSASYLANQRQAAYNDCLKGRSFWCWSLGLCANAVDQNLIAKCEGDYVCSGPGVDPVKCAADSAADRAKLAEYMAIEEQRGDSYNPNGPCATGEIATGISLFPCLSTTIVLLMAAGGLLVVTAVMRRR